MAKPVFDPSRPFETAAPSKPVFDPSKPFSTPGEAGGLGSAIRGLSQGATLGFGDELGAAFAPLTDKIFEAFHPEAKKIDPLTAYRDTRDRERSENAAAQKSSPLAFGAGQLLGGIATDTALGGLGAKGAASLIGQGAGAGLGYGDADLTRGQFGRAALDTGIGAAAGGLAAGAGALLGKGAAALANKAGGKVASIDAAALANKAAEAARQEGSLSGALGGATQDANRTVENLMRLEQSLTPEQRALFDQHGGIFEALKSKLADSSLAKLPGAAGRVDDARSALQAFQAGKPQMIAEQAAQSVSPSEAGAQLMARAKRYGLPALGGALGALTDDEHKGRGFLAGAGMGSIAGAGMRPMMHSLLRLGSNPAVQRMGASALQSLAGGASRAAPTALGDVERALGRELESGAASRAESAASNFMKDFPSLRKALGFQDEEERKALASR